MEIRQFDEVYGVIPNADIVEGRMVCMAAHTFSYDFGSRADLPGANVPATAEAAKNARFIITWAVDNRQPPYYQPQPSYNWALRGGWDQTANLPMTSTTVYMTYPGYQTGVTIPSGTPSLAFGEGIYTLTSGYYINHASIGVIGSLLQVANTAEDGAGSAGKLQYLASYGDRKVATVVGYSATTGELTFHIRP
jgi:hypothetical protein